MPKKKIGHGGARDGAGRPSLGRKYYTIRMKEKEHTKLVKISYSASCGHVGEYLEKHVNGQL